MNKIVQEFINKKKAEIENNKNKEKRELLMDLGICEKEYSQSSAWSEEYPDYEYDQETKEGRYFKKIPINVTDEEYEEILKYCKQSDNTTPVNKENKVAKVLTGIAYAIFIIGAILGFAMGYTKNIPEDTYYFSFAVAVAWWGVSFIGGMFMLGFAEIIKLLNAIKNK
nr:hypothetical protein [uncultured Ruminococcus sp.]